MNGVLVLLLLLLSVSHVLSWTSPVDPLSGNRRSRSSVGLCPLFGQSECVRRRTIKTYRHSTILQSSTIPSDTVVTKSKTKTIDTNVAQTLNEQQQLQLLQKKDNDAYAKGFAIIAFICLLNASTNPLWHVSFAGSNSPPPLFMNAAIAVTALFGLLGGSAMSQQSADDTIQSYSEKLPIPYELYGGMELGVWKFLGTSAHVFGLSLTSANHGAFLIQLTTLIVPVLQGISGERIPRQIQAAVALALSGVFIFTQDGGSVEASQTVLMGDALCVAAAFFYSLYDIQTFKWGKHIPRTQLVTTKLATQAVLSILLCLGISYESTLSYWNSNPDLSLLIPVVLWSGLIVNALATFLQVGGMQTVGPTRAQLIFASQPLWSAGLAYVLLHETVGPQGAVGGTAFLGALYLAATAPKPGTDEDDAVNESSAK